MIDKNKIIPIVFSVDDAYAPFLGVAIQSIVDNANLENFYKIYILNTDISSENEKALLKFKSNNFDISFVNVTERMDKINKDKIHLRDYYSKAIYYRIFIPSLFPEYKKILYLDCDIVAVCDVAKYFDTPTDGNIFVAVHEETMSFMNVFGEYSEKFLGVDRYKYFNSGILLFDCEQYNKYNIEEKFIQFMHLYKFEVAPDQDYLNFLCKDKIKYLDIGWNKTPFKEIPFKDEDLKIIHYKLNLKPWLYNGVRYEEYFWKYAIKTPFYNQLLSMRDNFSDVDAKNDQLGFEQLQNTAIKYSNGIDNYKTFKVNI